MPLRYVLGNSDITAREYLHRAGSIRSRRRVSCDGAPNTMRGDPVRGTWLAPHRLAHCHAWGP